MKKRTILQNIDAIILIVIATTCGSFTVWSIIVEKPEYYALLACGFLFAIALHFIFSVFIEKESSKKQEELTKIVAESKETILNSHKLTITSFKGAKVTDIIQNVDLYIAERIKNALKSVYDLNWQDYQKNSNPRNISDRKYSENAIDASIKEFCKKGNVTYQEIFTFSDNRNYPKLKTHINYGDNYSCSYYDNLEPLKKFPKIQFVIIDEKEVIFVSSAYGHSLCATRDEKIVEICCIYFKQAWDLSTKIKEEKIVHNNIITEIEAKYTA
ncbi:MAG: hypothetical protein LBR55_03620 [Bacteroidales bacterium]|jgi:hypothetical protein|nr:hypothetical protein [Bacteroidales bacterium]